MEYRLGQICKFQSGGTPAKGNPEYFNGNIPWITTTALNGSEINDHDAVDWITEKAINESAAKIVPANSIMVGTRVGVGKVAINKVPMSTSQDIISLLDIAEDKWDKDYLCKLIQANHAFLNSQARGATIKGIKIDVLAALKVPEIPLEKQRKVSDVINKTRGIINLRRKELESLDELIKARFVELFGEGLIDDGKYDLAPISEVGKVVSGATPKTSNAEYWGGDNLWVTPAELSDEFYFIYDTERKITDKGVKSCAVNLLPIGTVILSSRAPIGKVAIAGAEMYCNQGFKNIIPNEKINSVYLFELLKMETEYLNSLGRGATFKEISKQIVENIRIKVPPRKIQDQFADFVKQVDKSKVVA